MDTLTHIAIGACIGEAFFEKGFGKKALLWGILAQSIPDIDFLAALWLTTPENLLVHRGVTHSILFALCIVPFLAIIASKIHHKHKISFFKWIVFFAVEVVTHLFIDSFNNYGIGWFEPFNSLRISFNSVYVADPFFSVWAGVGCAMLLLLNPLHKARNFWWKFGVVLPAFYLCYCLTNKYIIDQNVQKIMALNKGSYQRYFTTPAPLQNWLWFVVLENKKGYFIGYRSVFDTKKEMDLTFFPKNNALLQPLKHTADVQQLVQFSQGFYTVENRNDTLLFNDLRFGQVIGWQNPKEQFAFHYNLQHPNQNKLVVQRGRFAKWNWKTTTLFWTKIKGN